MRLDVTPSRAAPFALIICRGTARRSRCDLNGGGGTTTTKLRRRLGGDRFWSPPSQAFSCQHYVNKSLGSRCHQLMVLMPSSPRGRCPNL